MHIEKILGKRTHWQKSQSRSVVHCLEKLIFRRKIIDFSHIRNFSIRSKEKKIDIVMLLSRRFSDKEEMRSAIMKILAFSQIEKLKKFEGKLKKVVD